MKAIPLFACLALVAPQVRAQNAPPADAAAPAQTATGERVTLADDIKSFRVEHPALPSEFERRLADIEKIAGESQTTDDLAKAENDFKILQEELTAKPAASASPNDPASNEPAFKNFGAFAAGNLTGARTDGARYFDLTGHSVGGGAWGGANENNRSAFSFVNAPSSALGLHVNPLPALADGSSLAAYFREWVQRNGISPLDYKSLEQSAPEPAPGSVAPPAEKPVMPSGNKPSSLAALATWIDRSGISDDVIEKLKTIKVIGGELLEGFGGYCYWGVKWMLTLVLPGVTNPKDLDLPVGDAYKLQSALKNDPKLAERLHLLPLDLKTVALDDAEALPERTLLIWDRGCAGFSATSGHVEFTLHADKMSRLAASAFYPLSRKYGFWVPNLDPKTEVLACSDGCEVQAMQKLRAYAGKCLNAYVPVVAAGN